MRLRHSEMYDKHINSGKNISEYLKIKRLKILQILTEFFTVDKQQFALLSKPSFQKLMSKQLKPLDIAGVGNLNDKNLPEIKENIHETAKKIRENLITEVQYKLVSMSVDVVTKNSRAIIIGIFIQYVHNDVSKIRCIGIKELTQRHTGKYLCTVVEKCLEENTV